MRGPPMGMAREDSAAPEKARLACAVCGRDAPWEVWETRMCDGCVSAWNTDPRFRKANGPEDYRALTATWLAEQRKARAA